MLGEGCAHRCGIDLSLELSDQRIMPFRFPVHRVLKSLKQPLHVCHTSFERLETIRLRITRVAAGPLVARAGPANLADPSEQALAVAYRHAQIWVGPTRVRQVPGYPVVMIGLRDRGSGARPQPPRTPGRAGKLPA